MHFGGDLVTTVCIFSPTDSHALQVQCGEQSAKTALLYKEKLSGNAHFKRLL